MSAIASAAGLAAANFVRVGENNAALGPSSQLAPSSRSESLPPPSASNSPIRGDVIIERNKNDEGEILGIKGPSGIWVPENSPMLGCGMQGAVVQALMRSGGDLAPSSPLIPIALKIGP